ncbi:MAG: Gfo/Idh/MocA family oxidoreductase [Pirellulales bacterium]|nr:Gfo/Idh/MocA family oxidoreductase [Pirellulales bacterium]
MKVRNQTTNIDWLSCQGEEGTSAGRRNQTTRRVFLQAAGLGAAALATQGVVSGAETAVGKDGKPIQGFEDITKAGTESSKGWKPISDRKIRVGIVGYGFCKFGAAFGFQDHPNVEVVAVSDLFPDRCEGLARATRCKKTYPSLEELVKDDTIEAVFCATDPPHHAQHCMEVLKHGKHIAVNVPAVFGFDSLEQADQLFEAVKKASGLHYMMFETSYYHPGLWPMRKIYQAGGFGRHVYSEGEYCHFHDGKAPMPSYKGWREGLPPLWYPTHSTAYYVGVTGGSFTHVSAQGRPGDWYWLRPGANKFNNTFATECALFRTSDGGMCHMSCSFDTAGHKGVKGRFRGELGSFEGDLKDLKHWGTFEGVANADGKKPTLPNLSRPPLPPNVDPGGHGGAEGQLMNEFVTAILQDRTPWCNIADALNMTVAGVVASQSAKQDGERLKVPQYTMPT